MPISSDVRINLDGKVPSARTLTNAVPIDVSMVDANGDQLTGFDSSRPTTAAITSVTVTTTSITLLTANTARRKFIIANDGAKAIFVALAATASSSAYTLRLPSGGIWESDTNDYTGVISAIRESGTGAVMVTELT